MSMVRGLPLDPDRVRERIVRLGGEPQFADQVREAILERGRYWFEMQRLNKVLEAWRRHVPEELQGGAPRQMLTHRAPAESDG